MSTAGRKEGWGLFWSPECSPGKAVISPSGCSEGGAFLIEQWTEEKGGGPPCSWGLARGAEYGVSPSTPTPLLPMLGRVGVGQRCCCGPRLFLKPANRTSLPSEPTHTSSGLADGRAKAQRGAEPCLGPHSNRTGQKDLSTRVLGIPGNWILRSSL